MKKFVFILPIILFFASCEPSSADFINTLTTSVNAAEVLVTRYDADILKALESNKTDSIVPLTRNTLGQLVKELEKIQSASVPKDGESMKSATESYIESLINFVKTQSNYADYTPTMPEEEVENMDKASEDALKAVELARRRYDEYRTAFSKTKGIR